MSDSSYDSIQDGTASGRYAAPTAAPGAGLNGFMFLLRRELWEHRALVIAPLIFLAVFVVGAAVGLARGHSHGLMPIIVDRLAGESGDLREALGAAGIAIWVVMSWIVAIVLAFYLLDCLYADRKDRSVLFWKSLPISDTQTVLSKLVVASVVAPLIAVAVAAATWLLLLALASVAVMLGGGNPLTMLWAEFPLLRLTATIVATELLLSLWFLPLTGWLLLASASARRTPFLLATLVPLGIVVVEKLAFDSSRALTLVQDYAQRFFENLSGNEFEIEINEIDGMEITGQLDHMFDLLSPLTDPVLYAGMALGAAFIAAAIVMRQRRVDAG